MSLTKIIDADGNKKDINIFIEKVSTGGRPKKILTEEAIKLVENLARIMCTEEEIATILDVSLDTLHNKENDILFRSAILRGRTVGKQSLRREQFRLAMKGNVKMLIWLGKQYLDQSDRIQQETKFNPDMKTLGDIVLNYCEDRKIEDFE